MLPREYHIFKEYGNIRHANLLSLIACQKTNDAVSVLVNETIKFTFLGTIYRLQFRNPGAFEKNNQLILIIIPTTPTMDVN